MQALVIGLGKSGRGAARFLRHLGYKVTGVDRLLAGKKLEGVYLFSEEESLPHFDFDIVILSPGIPQTHPLALRAQRQGIKLMGEAELALRHLKNPCIGITGTNGKTTLTLLIAHILNTCGKKARALGNVGESLAGNLIDLDPEIIVVAELSSFQLETLQAPAIDVGVITSITPDHLDRYPSFETYAQLKGHLSDLIKPDGWLFVSKEASEFTRFFSLKTSCEIIDPDSYLQLTVKERYLEKFGRDKIALAFAVCKKWGIEWEALTSAKQTFIWPSHRLESLGEIGGVTYYNDSKGTNPEAVLFALKNMERPVILIAGGLDKGTSFERWKDPFKDKVKGVFAIGRAALLIKKTLSGCCPVRVRATLEEATLSAKALAKPGEAILLSPGCSSFDQFANFEERGNRFKQLFQKLRSKE